MHQTVRLLILLLTLFAMGAGPVAAQSAGGAMKGVFSLKFFVSNFSQNNLRCRLTAAGFEEAFTKPLRERNIQITKSSAYWIFIRATTLFQEEEESCITYIDAQLMASTRFFNPATASERAGKVELWSDGGLYISDLEEHSEQVNDAFAQLGRRFVIEWLQDQN